MLESALTHRHDRFPDNPFVGFSLIGAPMHQTEISCVSSRTKKEHGPDFSLKPFETNTDETGNNNRNYFRPLISNPWAKVYKNPNKCPP
jgi:hypothetical protein